MELRKPKCRHGYASRRNGPSPEYITWQGMRQRCTNPNAPFFKNYGGRGIRVCDRWSSFQNFLADMGPRPIGTTLDRWPNPDGNYEPGNCQWSTPKEQNAHQKQNGNAKSIVVYGVLYKNATAAANDNGVRDTSVYGRMRRFGETFEQSITAINEIRKGIRPRTLQRLARG